MVDYTTGIVPLAPVHKPPYTIQSPGYEKVPGETIPRRHPRAKDGLRNRPAEEIETVFDIVRRSARIYPNHRAVGWRKLVKMHKEMKKIEKNVDGQIKEVEKEWQLFELTPYSYLTFKEYEQRVLNLGSGLRKLGMNAGDKLHLFGATSAPWISMSHACASQSIQIVTAYDTLGPEGLGHSLNQTNCEVMYIDPQLLKTASKPLKDSKVKTIIVNEDSIFGAPSQLEDFKAANPEYRIVTYEELWNMGEKEPVDPVPPKGSDLYCIMYTSGSTGLPKGACIRHESLVAGVTGLLTCVDECISDKEFVLAFLPLAHIFEMALENIVFFIGGTLGYSSPRTLSDTSVKNCAGDMREFRPTALVGVPQIWETVKKGVMSKLETSGPVARNLFWGAYNYKSFMTRNKMPFASVFDSVVFSKVRELTGGRVRFTMNGASSVADGTKQFLSVVVAPMINGYGLTETCANGALGSLLEYTNTAIGPIAGALDVKLVSIPEMGYDADAKIPQGEIYLKGLPIMTEYWQNPEETKKAVTEDGWFKTGDIGEFQENGHLKVIDRVKNLVKLAGGEYIALEKLESIYRGAQTVSNVMIHADPNANRPIAIIMPVEKILADKAKELGVDEHSMHTDSKVRGAVLKDLQSTGRSSGLSGMEIVSGVVITDVEWDPPSGLVTATQKINRRVIRERYQKELEECVKNSS